jgi:hypothetical protein
MSSPLVDTYRDGLPDAPSEDAHFELELRLSRDLAASAERLPVRDVRFMVDRYYAIQKNRLAFAAQRRTGVEADEPVSMMGWLEAQQQRAEDNLRLALARYARSKPLGRWAQSITGIGPVISAALLANVDVTREPSAGHLWRFAGLDPTVTWNRSEKRPWNASLKRLAFLIGESFVKVQNHERDVYGKVYVARKAYEQRKNEAGDYAEQARRALAEKRFREDTIARQHYERGQLPPGRLHLRAARYATKLFLAHYHACAYWLEYQAVPPKPFAISHLGHVGYLIPPHLREHFPDFLEALRAESPVVELRPGMLPGMVSDAGGDAGGDEP